MDAITGYEEYEQDFRLVSLPEYCWMAGQLLIEALEDYQPPENLAVYMPECLCRESSGYTFLFQAHMEDSKKGYSLLYMGYFNHGKEDYSHEAAFPPWKTYPSHG